MLPTPDRRGCESYDHPPLYLLEGLRRSCILALSPPANFAFPPFCQVELRLYGVLEVRTKCFTKYCIWVIRQPHDSCYSSGVDNAIGTWPFLVKGVAFMRRISLVLGVAVVMAAMIALTVGSALAKDSNRAKTKYTDPISGYEYYAVSPRLSATGEGIGQFRTR